MLTILCDAELNKITDGGTWCSEHKFELLTTQKTKHISEELLQKGFFIHCERCGYLVKVQPQTVTKITVK